MKKRFVVIISCLMIMFMTISFPSMAEVNPCPIHGVHQMRPRGGGVAYDGSTIASNDFIEGSLYQCSCGETIIFDGHYSVGISGYIGRILPTTFRIIKPHEIGLRFHIFDQNPKYILDIDTNYLPGYHFCTF